MEYDKKTYFTENAQDDVKGFTIIGTSASEGYHIAEKWLASDDTKGSSRSEDVWVQYWIPEAQLNQRVKDGACEPKAELSEKQYEKVCDMVGMPDIADGGVTA